MHRMMATNMEKKFRLLKQMVSLNSNYRPQFRHYKTGKKKMCTGNGTENEKTCCDRLFIVLSVERLSYTQLKV